MELLEEVLKNLWPNLTGAHWINVDTGDHKIGRRILQSRLTERGIDDRPIILYGFRSFESLVRSEKELPRLLVSPGVNYLYLPANWGRVENILNQAKENRLDGVDLKTELMDSAFAGSALARIESVLAHNIGNFLGPEKLLYGSHLAGMIDGDEFEYILEEEIRKSQRDALGDTQEYLLYRLSQINYKPQKIAKKSVPSIKGQILYIDDHAHLGWAWAVGSTLWGKCNASQGARTDAVNVVNITDASGDSTLSVINREGLSSSEDSFMNAALQIAGNVRILSGCDMILLDLRLRWKEDEKIGNQAIDELSGIKVLRKVRDTNAAIPVVVLTASRKARNLEKVLDLGADGYLIKEVPHPGEEDVEIKDYYHRFFQVVKETMSKSYLAEAWNLIQKLERRSIRDFLQRGIDYRNIVDDLKVDWKNDVIFYLNKAIALLKRRNTQFEKERLGLDLVKEAIINLSLPADTFYRKNQAYREGARTKSRLYVYRKPHWGQEFLLADLRAFSSHGAQQEIDEDDAKISLYLALRLFIAPSDLEGLARKLFDVDPARKELLSPNFSRKINSSLLSKLALSGENYEREIGGYRIVRKGDSVVVSDPNGEKFKSTITDLPSCLIYPKKESPIFQKLKFDRENYYLLFLSRLSSKIHNIKNSDYYLVSKISEKCGVSLFDEGDERHL